MTELATVQMSRPGRIPSLDGMRGLSIWAVMLAHATRHFGPAVLHTSGFATFLQLLAYFGVTVFLVISGFLITHLLLREEAVSHTISLRQFYARRVARICPAALIYIVTIVAIAHPTLSQDLYAFTFTTSYFTDQAHKGLQQLWSLSVEEQFYLLWPCVLLFGRLTAKRCCWLTLIVCPLLRFELNRLGHHQFAHIAPAIADSIAAGCLLAFYRPTLTDRLRRFIVSGRAFCILGFAITLADLAIYRAHSTLLWGAVPCSVAFVLAVAMERNDAVLNRGFIAWSGLISYSLYLWQQPFLTMAGPFDTIVMRLPLTFATAYLSYRFIERPVLRLAALARRSRSYGARSAAVAQQS